MHSSCVSRRSQTPMKATVLKSDIFGLTAVSVAVGPYSFAVLRAFGLYERWRERQGEDIWTRVAISRLHSTRVSS